MECVAPSAETWRDQSENWSDEELAEELERAWTKKRGFAPAFRGPPYNTRHHDWTNFRAATLREARKRGLDISIVGAAAHAGR